MTLIQVREQVQDEEDMAIQFAFTFVSTVKHVIHPAACKL